MPYALCPIPYILYPIHYILYPIPYTLYPIYPIPYTLYPIPCPLSPVPYPLCPTPYPRSVLGFDHTPLSEAQRGWAQHLFPYKPADYRYQLLTEPACIGLLDYQARAGTEAGTGAGAGTGTGAGAGVGTEAEVGTGAEPEAVGEVGSRVANTVDLAFTRGGRCDAVLTWVDYDLSPAPTPTPGAGPGAARVSVAHCSGGRFLHHAKASVKFFEKSFDIDIGTAKGGGAGAPAAATLRVEAGFEYGASDFSYSFSVVT
jgi:hypothetical protein